METRTIQNLVFFLLCAFVISDTGIAQNPSEAIQESQILFSPLQPIPTIQRDTTPGNVPIVNPTIPGTTPIVNPTVPPPPTTTTGPPTTTFGGSWCTASPTASETALQVALDYACGYGGADCSPIQPNGPCYDPNTLRDHASYAFNDYYQKNPVPTSCVFGGTAQLSYTDPSHGSCRYASGGSTPTTTPVTTPTYSTPTIPMTPPSPATVSPYTPGGSGFGPDPTGNDYGSEPTSTTNSAETLSLNLLLLITINCFIFAATISNIEETRFGYYLANEILSNLQLQSMQNFEAERYCMIQVSRP